MNCEKDELLSFITRVSEKNKWFPFNPVLNSNEDFRRLQNEMPSLRDKLNIYQYFNNHSAADENILAEKLDEFFKKGKKVRVSIEGVRISSTFSVLRPFSYIRLFLYFDRSISTYLFRPLLRPIYLELFTSIRLLRPLYFDLLSNLDFLLVETYRSKYSSGQSKEAVIKFWSK